jgi:hypothetical protein
MTVTGGKSLVRQAGVESYILELANEYEVSDRFLRAVVPKIKEIFELNIPPDQRESLLFLAEKSFKLQSETEAVLSTVSALTGCLKVASLSRTGSRRQRKVTLKDIGMIKKPVKARSAS